MTRNEIIKLARDALLLGDASQRIAAVQRFAALVAAAEREECAKVCEEQNARWADDRRAIYATDECAAAIRAMGVME